MCAHTQVPSQPKSEKLGWEAVDTFYWGYINTKRFTNLAVRPLVFFCSQPSFRIDPWIATESLKSAFSKLLNRRRDMLEQ